MCSDAAIHTSHVTSSSPSTFAKPSPAPGSRPRTSAASGAASRPTTSISRKSPSAASIAAGEGTLVAHVALRPSSPAAAAHRGLHARRPRPAPSPPASSARAPCSRSRAPARRAAARTSPTSPRPTTPSSRPARCSSSPASGRSTPSPSTSAALDIFPGFTPEQDVYRRYRRWGFESAALDLALRQADTSLHELLGRTAEPITFVVSSRMGEPPTIEPGHAPARRYPALRFKLDATPDWTEELIAAAAGDGRRRLDRLQGRLQGHARRTSDRPGVLPPHRRGVPGRLARGPRPRDRRGAQRARRPPGPDHLGRADPRRRGHPRRAR